jgi:hypothetical protein
MHCPYLPLVVSDSVIGEARGGEVKCPGGRGEGVDVGSVGKVGCKREEAGSVSASRWEDRERNQASVLPMGLRLLPPIGKLGGGGTGMRSVFDQELEAEVDGQDAH